MDLYSFSQELRDVQEKIAHVMATQLELKKLERSHLITSDQEVELEHLPTLLAELKTQQQHWQDMMKMHKVAEEKKKEEMEIKNKWRDA